jgi:hypothetical protein
MTVLSRIDRRHSLGVASFVLVAGILAGFLAVTPYGARIAMAACGSGFYQICYFDNTLTSVLDVSHGSPSDVDTDPVEPDTGETWRITAYWKTTDNLAIPAACRCNSSSAYVDVDVDWSGSSWSASCTGCNALAGPIFDVDVCADDNKNCSSGEDDHSYGYRMIADIARANTQYYCVVDETYYTRYLDSVTYTTTAVDDGYVLDTEECDLGSSVSPKSQTNSATDSGGFECAYNCTITGASVSIEYE